MIDDSEDGKVAEQVQRLSSMRGWPKLLAGQGEFARIAKKYARDIPHLEQVITEICESWDQCPVPMELKSELRGYYPGALQTYVPPERPKPEDVDNTPFPTTFAELEALVNKRKPN